ncbi:glycosyltransferase, partial [Streptomyces noursei]|uniref:glycosyltransferase n=1 Tax=Streptomyces noursei TaxID=1971 RepID=UPI00344C8DF9
MRAVALVHFYPPYRMAGSETMLHTMLSTLTDEGHDAFVVCTDMPEAAGRWTYERIPVFHPRPSSTATAKVAELRPDVIVTHHDHAALAIITARRLGVPSVFIQHNTFPSNRVILSMQPDLTVFNTEWVARDWRHHLEGRWMVVHPPVWARDHASPAGGRHVTLVNLNVNKGVHVFSHLAQLFPDVPFLGVEGAHGQQITVAGLSRNGPSNRFRSRASSWRSWTSQVCR